MTSDSSLVKIGGDISKPATVLIEKISDAIGGLYKPYQIRRVAKAEAEAQIIEEQAQIEITDLHRRALIRFVAEEAKRQENIERITEKAIPLLGASASPQDIDNDWITNFFDKCRIISDDEMQSMWAKVLAGEADSPGSYTKRTLNMLGSLDKSDAELFTKLCGFAWILNSLALLIYDEESSIYNNQGITFTVPL